MFEVFQFCLAVVIVCVGLKVSIHPVVKRWEARLDVFCNQMIGFAVITIGILWWLL